MPAIPPVSAAAYGAADTAGDDSAARLCAEGVASGTENVITGARPRCGMKHYVVIADADPEIRRTVVAYFETHGVAARAASSKRDLLACTEDPDLALIVLDRHLDKGEGSSLFRQIRAQSDVPVIVMTEGAWEEWDRISFLERGADDCVAKPLSLRSLLARFRAILRRQRLGHLARDRNPKRGGYRFGGWRLERRSRRLLDPTGAAVSLTKREFALLLAFLAAPQRPLTRDQLLLATRPHEDVFDRSIDVQISRLRKKLKVGPAAPSLIRTERGVGYAFVAAVEAF